MIARALLYFLSLGVAGYAVIAYTLLPLGSLVHNEMQVNFEANRIGIYAHVFFSALALTLGPFQFAKYLRRKHVRVHRWLGRLYLGLGVLVGGLSGLYMSFFAFGEAISKLGFAVLAQLWLFTGFKAYQAIARGKIAEHRSWMIRNFSLTLAAVTLRLYLPLSMAAGIEFLFAYSIIAWLCWVPNLLLAEWHLRKTTPLLDSPISKKTE